MEEQLEIPKQHQQSINPTFDSNFELFQAPKVTKNPNQHRHVSLIYGLQFQSKVSLFVRQQSQSTILTDFQNISKEEMYKKVLTFLNLVVTDASMFETFIKPFKILDEEMNLSIKKSRSSIYSDSGQINLSSGSDCNSNNNIKQVFTQLTNSRHQIEEQATSKKRTQMMSKSNRVSLAQAISINQLQKFVRLEAIQSASSLQSFQSSLKEFKSKRRLSSQQSDNKSDCKSISQAIALVNKHSERKNKISITLMDELSVSSQLFSQGETGLSLSDIKLPGLKVDQVMLEVFFDPPSPYLINLSLCLFCKCLSRGLLSLKEDSIGWLFGVSTIVAYKLYYDEPIEGLLEWFCEGMSMILSDLIKLQRWFLGSLKYEAAVSTQQYQNMLMRLMTIS